MQALVEAILRPVRYLEALPAMVQNRLVGAGLFLPSAGVLGTAVWLTPDPSGMGTHTQLGLGGCAVLTFTGYPCPMCGMTTTFTHLAHLELIQGTINQPFGLILFLCTIGALLVGGLSLFAGSNAWRKALAVVERHEVTVAAGLILGMFGGWAYKIAMVKEFL